MFLAAGICLDPLWQLKCSPDSSHSKKIRGWEEGGEKVKRKEDGNGR